MHKEATLSECGTYRYNLVRRWGDGPALLWVMLNPSTADAEVDDPTIRRCIGFARGSGRNAIEVVNLYALRSPSPADLWKHPNPIGPCNDAAISAAIRRAADAGGAMVVAAWGGNAKRERAEAVMRILTDATDVYALGQDKDGRPTPGHPLYIPGSRPLSILAARGSMVAGDAFEPPPP